MNVPEPSTWMTLPQVNPLGIVVDDSSGTITLSGGKGRASKMYNVQ